MRRLVVALAACALLGGCGESFSPETVVDGLRVLGIRATPAELHPGQAAQLEGLVVDPSRPGRRSTVLWLGCDPDPFDLGRSACSDPKVLADPSALGAPGEDGAAPRLPPGMHLIGLNERAVYSAPPDAFAQLPEGDARRLKGSVAQVLAFAVAEEISVGAPPEEISQLLARVRAKEVKSIIALFRIRVTEEQALNQNPGISGLWVDGGALAEGATLRVAPGSVSRLEVTVPDAALEEYDALQPEGLVHKTERVVAAWYSSWGRFSEARVALRTEAVERFTAPGTSAEPLPEDRAGTFYAVVRDTRGGQSWARYPGYLCDPSLPAPAVSALEPPSGKADGNASLALVGEHLDSVLDVQIGGKTLRQGAYSPSSGRFEGALPELPPGEHPVIVRGKHCADADVGLAFQAL